jgi:hypothetical protein
MCFSLSVVEHLLIWIVVVAAVFAIIRLLLALVTPAGEFAWAITTAIQVVKIILYAVIVIAVIVVVFALLACIIPFPALR